MHCAVFQFEEHSSINIFITIQYLNKPKCLDNQEKQEIIYESKDNCINISIHSCQI